MKQHGEKLKKKTETEKAGGSNAPAPPTKDIMSFFPINKSRPSARPNQRDALVCVEHLLKAGTKVIVIEGPVGSGKSAMAVAIAKYLGDAHILTPRRSLQDQYMDDFPEEKMACMKGRSSYPCIPDMDAYDSLTDGRSLRGIDEGDDVRYNALSSAIIVKQHDLEKFFRRTGRGSRVTCSDGLCSSDERKYYLGDKVLNSKKACQINRPCPYVLAGEVANNTPIAVHNLMGFMYQNIYAAMFTEPRGVLIVDEAHDLEGVIRDFASTPFSIHMDLDNLPPSAPRVPPFGKDKVSEWATFLSWEGFVRADWAPEDKEAWSTRLKFLLEASDSLYRDTITFATLVVGKDGSRSHKVHIVPLTLGKYPNDLFFQYADRVVLMSGTIYDKDAFCKRLGIDPAMAAFIRIPSEFPVDTRPIYYSEKLVTNNSHASWNSDEKEYETMLFNIKQVMAKYPDVKGLIHAPSYFMAEKIVADLGSKRIMSHTASDFSERLLEFYASKGNTVFMSPVCQQGVDFKYDRARFQIILRVPYPSTSDPFMEYMVSNNFPWYNLQALITFGQMIGRINRAADDQGATHLLDNRFKQFLKRNAGKLPRWLKDSIKGVY